MHVRLICAIKIYLLTYLLNADAQSFQWMYNTTAANFAVSVNRIRELIYGYLNISTTTSHFPRITDYCRTHTSELRISYAYSIFTAQRCASAVYAVVICPSVRPSQAGIVSTDQSSWFLACGLFPLTIHWAIKKFCRYGTSKNKGTSLWHFAPNSRKFRHGKSIYRCQQNSSTVELVDDTCATIDKSWLWLSVNCNPLTPLL